MYPYICEVTICKRCLSHIFVEFLGSSTADLIFVLLVACYTAMSLCNMQYIQQCSGVLVVFVTCITVSIKTKPEICVDMAQGLKGIWVFAEVFLFTLTGTSLSFDSSNGPLYGQRGLSPQLMEKVLQVMFVGTGARVLGLGITILMMYNSLPPHRKKYTWWGPFWLNCWIYQLPKATVQATLGAVAYTQHIIPGTTGLSRGFFIAQATAFTVLIFAPLGALLTNYVGVRISKYLAGEDKLARWNSSENRYRAKSIYVAPTREKSVSVNDVEEVGRGRVLSKESNGYDRVSVGDHEREGEVDMEVGGGSYPKLGSEGGVSFAGSFEAGGAMSGYDDEDGNNVDDDDDDDDDDGDEFDGTVDANGIRNKHDTHHPPEPLHDPETIDITFTRARAATVELLHHLDHLTHRHHDHHHHGRGSVTGNIAGNDEVKGSSNGVDVLKSGDSHPHFEVEMSSSVSGSR